MNKAALQVKVEEHKGMYVYDAILLLLFVAAIEASVACRTERDALPESLIEVQQCLDQANVQIKTHIGQMKNLKFIYDTKDSVLSLREISINAAKRNHSALEDWIPKNMYEMHN